MTSKIPAPCLLALTLLLPATAGASPASDAVLRLVERDLYEKAQLKCTRYNAQSRTAEADVREICARAYWPKALAENTIAGWAEYRRVWAGTKGEQPAFEHQAHLAVETILTTGREADFLKLAATYEGTKAAARAKTLAARTAARDATTQEEALRVAQAYPETLEDTDLLERFLGGLVQIETTGAKIKITPRAGVKLPSGTEPTGRWAAVHGDRTSMAWDDEAEKHLLDAGLDPALVRKARTADSPLGRAFPLCHDPGAGPDWKAGIEVTAGTHRAIVEGPYAKGCDKDAWPAFVSFEGERPMALSLRPGHVLRLPTDAAAGGFEWQSSIGPRWEASLYVPFAPGDLIVGQDAKVVGLRMGKLFMVFPLAGGMPWLTDKQPPEDALTLGSGLKAGAMPLGWSLQPDQGAALVNGAALLKLPAEERIWGVPGSDIRPLTPQVQLFTGLSGINPELAMRASAPLPEAGSGAFWVTTPTGISAVAPAGAVDVGLEALTKEMLTRALFQLTGAGIAVVPTAGWRCNLDEDPALEVVIEATIGESDVRVLADPYRSGDVRTYVFDVAPKGTRGKFEPFAFRYQERVYVAFTGTLGSAAHVESLHFDERGLVREHSKK